MANIEHQPTHGEYGGDVMSQTVGESGTTATTMRVKARWCATCREWITAQSVVSMVVSAVACPKCKAKW